MESVTDNGVVVCWFEMRFAGNEADRAVQLLLSVVERIGVKVGCESCSVARNEAEPNRVIYSELWSSESHFRSHVRSGDFRSVLVAMDMSLEQPGVVVGALTGRTGLDYLQEVRGGPEPGVDERE